MKDKIIEWLIFSFIFVFLILPESILCWIFRFFEQTIYRLEVLMNRTYCFFEQIYNGDNPYTWWCSFCYYEWYLSKGHPRDFNYNFCPNCGSKIKEYRDYKGDEN